MQEMAEKNPSQIVIVVADMARTDPPLSSSFVAEFCQRLSRLSPALYIARGWKLKPSGSVNVGCSDARYCLFVPTAALPALRVMQRIALMLIAGTIAPPKENVAPLIV